jgi:hypothetical protein
MAEPLPPLISIAVPTAHSSTNQQLPQDKDAIFVNDKDLLGDLE